jgi:hypothetical protein
MPRQLPSEMMGMPFTPISEASHVSPAHATTQLGSPPFFFPCGSATPTPIQKNTRETTDLPGSWGTLLTVRLGLGPRWDRHARPCGVPTRPPLVSTTTAPDGKTAEARCPGFPSDCLRLVAAVARRHARRASGCRPALPGGIRTRRVPRKGFRVVVVTSPPPLPGLAWRNDTNFPTLSYR